jgi:hypothetical protein
MSICYGIRVSGLILLLPALCWAQSRTTETDWLQLVEGYKGDTVGAEVRHVETDEATGEQKLIIAIPKIAMSHPNQMEEVVVVGQAPKESKPIFDFKYEVEWLDDYDSNHYGLLIRLGKKTNWPIRLFMHSDDGPRTQRDITNP